MLGAESDEHLLRIIKRGWISFLTETISNPEISKLFFRIIDGRLLGE